MSRIITDFLSSKSNLGEKGNNLRILAKLFETDETVKVPKTIVLTTALFKEIILENGKTDFSNYQMININPQICSEILKNIHTVFGESKLVIRSSATCEDSIFFSGSGQYESFLNINTDTEILNAIKKVYASLFSKNSLLYSKIYQIDLTKESMAVVIQNVAPVIKSGVMFSCNPVNGEKTFIIELTEGLGTSVVEGNGNINSIQIKYEDKDKIDNELIKKLISTIEKIKDAFGVNVDIELGIDSNNVIYIFQTRPVIQKSKEFSVKYAKNLVSTKCTAISKGFSIGKIENISESPKGKILFQDDKYNFNDLELLVGSKGVILKEMSRLSHFANILRELVKPCVYVEKYNFAPNKLYVLDAFNENIIDFDALEPNTKVEFFFEFFKYMINVYEISFERFNGILKIFQDNKIEQVVFDIDEQAVLEYLKQNNFKKQIIKQSIYTYDFEDKSLINGNSIFRIQVSNGKINIQFKKLNSSSNKYRREEGIIISFDSLQNAKEFMNQLNVLETGYQERTIIKYVSDDVIVNIIKWPSCNPYLGIESDKTFKLDKFASDNGFDETQISSMGGKEIFKKLNLTLTDSKFGGRNNEKKSSSFN